MFEWLRYGRVWMLGLAMAAAGCDRAGSPRQSTSPSATSQPAGRAAASVPTILPAGVSIRTLASGDAVAELLDWRGESAVTVTIGGSVMFRRAFFSDSSWNGYRVLQAAFSPDARYLALKMNSSGGHQPYRTPVWILPLRDDKRELIDAETIIGRNIKGNRLAVGHEREPYIQWISSTQVRVRVTSLPDLQDAGLCEIDMATLKARQVRE